MSGRPRSSSRTRRSSSQSRRSSSKQGRSSSVPRPRRSSSRNGRSSRSNSGNRRRSQSGDRKIYQPPRLQIGFEGREGTDDFQPFTPDSESSSGRNKGMWDRVSATQGPTKAEERGRKQAKYDSDDRSASYYQEMKDEMDHDYNYAPRDNYASRDNYAPRDSYAPRNNYAPRGRGRPRGDDYYDPPPPPSDYDYADYDPSPMTPKSKKKLSHWYHNRFPVLSKSESTMKSAADETVDTHDTGTDGPASLAFADTEASDYLKTKQELAYCSIALTAIQLLILMVQLAMCGIAPMDVNPVVGPFPDAFSEWGGKNSYLMLTEDQWWRLFTPALLHVGILHLAVNAFCQLDSVAMFEREWGSFRWLIVYIMSTLGCSVLSNMFDPDTIAVTSSGSVMGLFAAKLAQVSNFTFFDSNRVDVDDIIRLDQLSSVLCGLIMLSLLGMFTFIDWSGNMGGLLTGYLTGLVLFSDTIASLCTRFVWVTLALAALISSLVFVWKQFLDEAEPDEQLGDVCEYYRHLYPENYECGCFL